MTGEPDAGRHAVVLADGDGPTAAGLEDAWPGWREGIGLVVAADGGARLAHPLGLTIDLWVGDGDSLGTAALEALAAGGTPTILARADKDESDTELALVAALDRGFTDITVLGAFGGRLDHALANLALLAHPRLRDSGATARLLDERTRVMLLRAPGPDGGPVRAPLDGRAGDLVSLLPFGGRVEGVVTEGLRYPLADETLELGPARGLSNVRLTSRAHVSARRGLLLVVESPATLSQ